MTSNFLIIALGLLTLHQTCGFTDDAVPFNAQPQDEPYYVGSGQEGPTLRCSFGDEFRDRQRYEHFWQRVANGNGTPRLITRDHESFSPDEYILIDDFSSGTYDLKIKSVDFDKDNGKFFCSILDRKNRNQKDTRPANIVVVVPPSSPTFEKQPKQAVKENDLVSFECQTAGGNPEPTFSWVFENKTSVPEPWYQVRSLSNNVFKSILQWRIDANENGAYVICEIWNKAMPDGEKKTVSSDRLNVLYPPRVHAGPTNPYNVEEGERAELRCEAEGNPEPSRYEWIHVATGETHSGAVWSFIADKRLHGDFRCVAENSLDKSSSKLSVNVLYGPIVSVLETSSPAEDDNVNIECIVNANPVPVNTSITWEGPNGFSQSGKYLQINDIKRTQAGNYTCSVVNTLDLHSSSVPVKRTGRATAIINVRHLPGNAVISSSTQFVKVGDRIVLTCSLDDEGSPKASYKWIVPSHSNTEFGSNHDLHLSQLVVDNVTLLHNGIYKCIPYNDIGVAMEANFRVLVVESPKIVASSQASHAFVSGDRVTLSCEATGYPAPKITWKKDDIDIIGDLEYHWETGNSVRSAPCEFCSTHVSGTLVFSALWSDKGNYTCTAQSEGSGMLDQRTTVLTISHAPKIMNPVFNGRSLTATDIGSKAQIVCRVSSRPEPTITWTRGSVDQTLAEDDLSFHTSAVYGSIDEYESVLQIDKTVKADYGEYICRATNGNGPKSERSIYLEESRSPEVPQFVRLLKKSTTWMQIGWQPGFDGGHEQHFELEYRSLDVRDAPSTPTVFILYPTNVSKEIVLDVNGSSSNEFPFKTYMSHNLTALSPLAHIQYRIRSVSSIGHSEWSPLREECTADVDISLSLSKPYIRYYDTDDHSIALESTNATPLCYMVYSGKKRSIESQVDWYSIGCLEPSHGKITDITGAEYFLLRSCVRQEPFLCSAGAEIHVERIYNTASFLIYLIAALATATLLTAICILIVVQYRRKNSLISTKQSSSTSSFQREDLKRDQVERISMPHTDAKNTLIHGSQTDSGVFTLRSAQDFPSKNIISGDPSTDNWSPNPESEHGYDFHNDQYVQSYPDYMDGLARVLHGPKEPIGLYGMYSDGPYLPDPSFDPSIGVRIVTDDNADSDSASFSVDGSSRRVIKEIIV